MRSLHLPLAAALVLAAACSKEPEKPPEAGTPARAAGPATFTLKDLAAATALDARLARVTLAAGDLQAALAAAGAPQPPRAGTSAPAAERAAALVGALHVAVAEAERALAGIANPADRAPAQAAVAAAREYAAKLVATARDAGAGARVELHAARDRLGAAIAGYRGARAAWRLEAPEPQGAEREFAEARREMERAETAFGSRTRVAPREEGHELDPATLRMTGLMAAERAKVIAGRLAPALAGPAARYAAAEERALAAVTGLAEAAEAERVELARRHQEAKAEALAALADYFAALASR